MLDLADSTLKLLILGAHPDDSEYFAGGLATLYRRLGHAVRMVSLTNGAAGHQRDFGPPLTKRRKAEAAAAARQIGAEYVLWDWPDGQLQPTLEVRAQVIREIRSFQPDLVLTHRTNDYHPDHRAVGQVVADASFLVTVPAIVPDVAALRKDPVVAFMPDRFTKPTPLQPDVVIDVSDCVEQIVDMLVCHQSQFYEWVPYNRREDRDLPLDDAGKKAHFRRWYLANLAANTERFRSELVWVYGPERGAAIRYAEAFEISEYATPLDAAGRARLFPMLPTRANSAKPST
ncbi:MAG TPA: PIG-L family deacetylase [Pirellulales bacterium]|nr:PIG-L family deacetylase [Pirellulales bacterium]